MVDFPEIFQDLEGSCTRGRGTLGVGVFDEESPNELDQTFLSLGQFDLPDSNPTDYRTTTNSGRQLAPVDPESAFLAELRKLETRVRHSDRRLRSHVG